MPWVCPSPPSANLPGARGGSSPSGDRTPFDATRWTSFDDLPDLFQQHVRSERLLDQRNARLGGVMSNDRVGRVARHEKDPRVGTKRVQLRGQLSAVHVRHHDVGEKQVDLARMRRRNGQCFLRARGLENRVAVAAKYLES